MKTGANSSKKTTYSTPLVILAFIGSLQVAFFAGIQVASLTRDGVSTSPDGQLSQQVANSGAQQQKTSGSMAFSFKLAYDQSYGFFDDINDETWRRHQQVVRTQPDHKFNDPLKFWFHPGWWYINNYEPTFTCPNLRRVGGVGDGPKWTCDPHRLIKIANDRKRQAILQGQPNANTTAHCLIYSIGSAGKFDWENGLIDIVGTKTCEIHIFDPGNFKKGAMKEKNMFYHRWGFRSSYASGFNPVIRGKFKTFQKTLTILGHWNRTIDILKIDCEFCEWFCYKDFLTTADVRQILVETHELPHPIEDGKGNLSAWPYPTMNATEYFDAFKQNNFHLFSKEINGHPKAAVSLFLILRSCGGRETCRFFCSHYGFVSYRGEGSSGVTSSFIPTS